jgi:exonuclease III
MAIALQAQTSYQAIPVRITRRLKRSISKSCESTVGRNNLIRIATSPACETNTITGSFANAQLCSFGMLNCRSVRNKTVLLKDYVVENRFDIFAVTETWLHSDESDNMLIGDLTPKGYLFKHTARQHGRGGGVGLLYNNSLHVKQDTSDIFSRFRSFEAIGMQFRVLSQTLDVVVLYRPPNNTSIGLFMQEFGSLLEMYAIRHGSLIIAGDFNIHVNDKSDSTARDFISLIESFNLQQRVQQATHSAGHTLDLVLSRCDESVVHTVTVHDVSISDHSTVMCKLNFERPSFLKKQVTSRKIKAININSLVDDIEQSQIFNHDISCINEMADIYNSELSRIVDHHAPLITRNITIRPAAPWYNEEIRSEKRIRRKLERIWRTTKQPSDRLKYRRQCRRVAELLTESRTLYYSQIIHDNEGDQRKLFKTVDKLLHRTPEPQYPICQSTEVLANKFLEFFEDKILKIHTDLSNSPQFSQNNFPDTPLSSCKFEQFKEIIIEDLIPITQRLAKKSCNLDPIPAQLLTKLLHVLNPVILRIVNTSLRTAELPSKLKHAMLNPVLKKFNLDHLEFNNFRPISNLSFLSKVIEKVVAVQMIEYLDHNGLYERFQSAYRRLHSTETALLKVHDDIAVAIDNGKSVIFVMLDLSAAFDTVDHDILLSRLSTCYGISGAVLEWFKSYLSERTQFVRINDSYSQSSRVTQGVPQGSVLGPILYSLYTSPLASIAREHDMNFHLYADDTQLYVTFSPISEENMEIAIYNTEKCVNTIETWMMENKLKMNNRKTDLIVFSSPYRPRPPLHLLSVSGHAVECSSLIKNIGVSFEESLSFVPHITATCKAAFFHLHNILRIRKFLSEDAAKTIIHSLVTSKLDYCNSILYGQPKYAIGRLQYVQNCAARIIYQCKKYEHVTPLFKSLHWLPIEQRVKFKILVITFKALHGLAPSYIADLIKPYVPARNLRSANQNLLHQPKFNLKTFGARAFSVSAPMLWNSMPVELKQKDSINSFKKGLKTWLFIEAFS